MPTNMPTCTMIQNKKALHVLLRDACVNHGTIQYGALLFGFNPRILFGVSKQTTE